MSKAAPDYEGLAIAAREIAQRHDEAGRLDWSGSDRTPGEVIAQTPAIARTDWPADPHEPVPTTHSAVHTFEAGGKLEPGSAEWLRVITPSKVAAILGVSRWESPYRLWHRMKGITDPEPPKDIFDVGHDFEPAMAAMYKREHTGWQLSPGEVSITADHRFGFPCGTNLDRRARRGRGRRVVEFKTARHLEDWGDFFTDQAPADYVAQVLAQMAFTGYTRYPAHLMVLGPYFEAHTYEIGFDAAVWAVIVERLVAFWHSLKGSVPPELDDTVATYDCVRELHPDIDGDRTVSVPSPLGRRVLQLKLDLDANERALRGAKTELLDLMGNAHYAESLGVRIADRRPARNDAVALYLQPKKLDELEELAGTENTTTDEEF